jgi:hypothetical protein
MSALSIAALIAFAFLVWDLSCVWTDEQAWEESLRWQR